MWLVVLAGFVWGVVLAQMARELYREHTRSLSPRDGGTPKNIRRVRPRFDLFTSSAPPGWYFKLARTRWADVARKFNGAYRAAWVDVELHVVGFGRQVRVRHWRERQLS